MDAKTAVDFMYNGSFVHEIITQMYTKGDEILSNYGIEKGE